MRNPVWGDTILYMLLGLAIAAVPFCVWLALLDFGPAPSGSALSDPESSVHVAVARNSGTAVGWFWLLATLASSASSVALFRRLRRDAFLDKPQRSVGAQ